jgi:hypothetical protein
VPEKDHLSAHSESFDTSAAAGGPPGRPRVGG